LLIPVLRSLFPFTSQELTQDSVIDEILKLVERQYFMQKTAVIASKDKKEL